jgi:hypothetical protein
MCSSLSTRQKAQWVKGEVLYNVLGIVVGIWQRFGSVCCKKGDRSWECWALKPHGMSETWYPEV